MDWEIIWKSIFLSPSKFTQTPCLVSLTVSMGADGPFIPSCWWWWMFFRTVKQGFFAPTGLELLVRAQGNPRHHVGGAWRSPRCKDAGGDVPVVMVTLTFPRLSCPFRPFSLYHLCIDRWISEGTQGQTRFHIRVWEQNPAWNSHWEHSGLDTSDLHQSPALFQPKSFSLWVGKWLWECRVHKI